MADFESASKLVKDTIDELSKDKNNLELEIERLKSVAKSGKDNIRLLNQEVESLEKDKESLTGHIKKVNASIEADKLANIKAITESKNEFERWKRSKAKEVSDILEQVKDKQEFYRKLADRNIKYKEDLNKKSEKIALDSSNLKSLTLKVVANQKLLVERQRKLDKVTQELNVRDLHVQELEKKALKTQSEAENYLKDVKNSVLEMNQVKDSIRVRLHDVEVRERQIREQDATLDKKMALVELQKKSLRKKELQLQDREQVLVTNLRNITP